MAQSPCFSASPCWFPFASLPFPFTYLEPLLGVIGSCPPWSQVARKLISPSPPHSKIPTPWSFPELHMRLTKTTSLIWITRSRTIMSSKCLWRAGPVLMCEKFCRVQFAMEEQYSFRNFNKGRNAMSPLPLPTPPPPIGGNVQKREEIKNVTVFVDTGAGAGWGIF